MNAKEAKKIFGSSDGRAIYLLARRHGAISWVRHYQAKGYLAALKGEEMKAKDAEVAELKMSIDKLVACYEERSQEVKALVIKAAAAEKAFGRFHHNDEFYLELVEAMVGLRAELAAFRKAVGK